MTDTQSTTIDLINELEWRGLLKDRTDKEGLRTHLETGTRKIYAGFDPTADSLTIGNLVPIMLLAHVKRAGHTPVVVMGGGTGLIGDPSGKSAERQMMTEEIVESNVESQEPIFASILGEQGKDYISFNNLKWLSDLSFLGALRDIGKHMPMNVMLQKDSVRERLNNREQGISYLEFSYQVLQAYDFAHLYEHEGVTVQLGGSDQYGNIVAGCDLIRRNRISVRVKVMGDFSDLFVHNFDKLDLDPDLVDRYRESIKNGFTMVSPRLALDEAMKQSHEVVVQQMHYWDKHQSSLPENIRRRWESHLEELKWASSPNLGLTAPLVAKADGGKFGKTETGAIWLTANRTSPYAYYQFWLNASDDDAANWIKVFTFLSQDEVEALIAAHSENPGKRELQRTLAQEATKILHGEAAMLNAENAGKALFSGEIGSLDADTMLEVFASVPTTEHAKAELTDSVDMVELLKAINLASSNREAREFLNAGSVSINGDKITIDTKLTTDHLLHDAYIAIRRGKKKWHLTKWA